VNIVKCDECGFGYIDQLDSSSCPKCAANAPNDSTSERASDTSVSLHSSGAVPVAEAQADTRSARRSSQDTSGPELDVVLMRIDKRTADFGKRLAAIESATNRSKSTISHLAVAALTAAFIFPLAAIILGHSAQREIRESEGHKYGEGLAIAALILGYLGIAGLVFWIWAAVTATSQGY